MKKTLDLEEVLEAIKAGASIDGKEGILAPLIKQLTEAALEAELELHYLTNTKNTKLQSLKLLFCIIYPFLEFCYTSYYLTF